jgi:hypothetical protein
MQAQLIWFFFLLANDLCGTGADSAEIFIAPLGRDRLVSIASSRICLPSHQPVPHTKRR